MTNVTVIASSRLDLSSDICYTRGMTNNTNSKFLVTMNSSSLFRC
ncbi:hypothetical protein SEA_BIG4_168 [Microbacterium phage Big4]|nr:hypothetical protein SEA_BIG4_168 [Microbacterium phage Big4]